MKYILHIFAISALLIASAVTDDALAARPKAVRKAKPTADELYRQAEKAFYEYRFDEALTLLDDYEDAISSGKKRQEPAEGFERLRMKSELGSTMMGRVEKIAIIDSLTVDSADFFRAYKLSTPSGFLSDTSALPEDFSHTSPTSVYITESGENMMWGAPDPDGKSRLVQSALLADGSWETPHSLGSALTEDGNANFPFLMSDGTTLYYAADGDASLGGYDIFISRNDGDEYLQPQNVGMPYNSPYNDFLLAIDDITGAGWWATDRNHIPGKATIYVFVPQELRVNYPFDTPGLDKLAFITDISTTRDQSPRYASVLKAISELTHNEVSATSEFQFAMPGGRIYTSMSDFRSSEAASIMDTYLEACDDMQRLQSELAGYRIKYRSGDKSVTDAILRAEKERDSLRHRITRLANSVIIAEEKAL